jgi:WD40 repeat protein
VTCHWVRRSIEMLPLLTSLCLTHLPACLRLPFPLLCCPALPCTQLYSPRLDSTRRDSLGLNSTQAHPGGVLSLEFERPGHLLASCGADRTVQTWDLNTNSHVTTFHVSHTPAATQQLAPSPNPPKTDPTPLPCMQVTLDLGTFFCPYRKQPCGC